MKSTNFLVIGFFIGLAFLHAYLNENKHERELNDAYFEIDQLQKSEASALLTIENFRDQLIIANKHSLQCARDNELLEEELDDVRDSYDCGGRVKEIGSIATTHYRELQKCQDK